jgi:ubiquinone biosynthesis protein
LLKSKIKKIFNLFRIYYILTKYGIYEVLFTLPLPNIISLLLRSVSLLFPNKYKQFTYGKRLKLALIELGPMYVKFGQILSTRTDLFSKNISVELATLQDKVPGFSGEISISMIESRFNKPIHELFLKFSTKPTACASIAQVHDALLHDGSKVVVKVLRPNIHKIINQDVDLLLSLAKWATKFSAAARRFKIYDIAKELQTSILNELDLVRDAANCAQLKRNFHNSKLLYVPKVYWEYTSSDIMVMERLSGIPISDIETLKSNHVNLKKLSERGVEIFYTQVFRDCFFHADMHPGNVWVDISDPEDPSYLALDFGIIGTLNNHDQRYLAENFIAFFNRDYRRVAQLHIESGWVPPTTRVDEFESAIRAVCEPIFERPLKDISFGKTLLRLFQTAKSFNMEIQPQLILLQKTLINVEGLGRVLYPELDLWTTAKPFLENWMKKQIGPKAFMKKIKSLTPYWLEIAPELPGLTYQALKNNQAPLKAPEAKTRPFHLIIFLALIITFYVYIDTQVSTVKFSPIISGILFTLSSITAFLLGAKGK